jgi:LysM repeat protein
LKIKPWVDLKRITGIALSSLLVTLPQPAQAAGYKAPCQTYYTVQAGDTTSSIANKFGIRWLYIYNANNLKGAAGPELKVGISLCIPPKWWPNGNPNVTFNASAKEKLLTLTISGYANHSRQVSCQQITHGLLMRSKPNECNSKPHY